MTPSESMPAAFRRLYGQSSPLDEPRALAPLTVTIAAPGAQELTTYDPLTNTITYQPKTGMSLGQVRERLAAVLKERGVNVRVTLRTGMNRAARRKQAKNARKRA